MMGMAKRALSDSSGNLFICLSVWSFFIFLRNQNVVKYIIFLVVFYLAILVREPSFLLISFFVVFFITHKYLYKNKISNAYLLGIMVIPIAATFLTYVIFFGGLGNTLALLKVRFAHHFLDGPSSYGASFCTGPWYKFIIDFLLISPITTLLFIGYFFSFLVKRKFEWQITYFWSFFLVSYVVLNSIRYGKIVRFVAFLDMAVCLFAVFMLYDLFRQDDRRRQTYTVFIAVFFIFLINYLNFLQLFCFNNIYDPVSTLLLMAKRIIPPFLIL